MKCNSSSPTLTDIVLFGLLLKVFKTHLLGRGLHTLVKNVLFSSLNDVGSHNPPPLGPVSSLALVPYTNRCGTIAGTPPHVRPFRGSVSSLAHCPVSSSNTICNSPFRFRLPLKVFKPHMLGRDFHTLIKNASFSSPTDVGSLLIDDVETRTPTAHMQVLDNG